MAQGVRIIISQFSGSKETELVRWESSTFTARAANFGDVQAEALRWFGQVLTDEDTTRRDRQGAQAAIAWLTDPNETLSAMHRKGGRAFNDYGVKVQIYPEWIIQGNYGHGWEDLTAEETEKEGRAQLATYRENEPQASHRLVKR